MGDEQGLGEEGGAEWTRAFMDYIWPMMPRKVGKMAALSVWMGVKYRPRTQETLDKVMAALEKAAPEWNERMAAREDNYVPHLRTWLYQQRYLDEE